MMWALPDRNALCFEVQSGSLAPHWECRFDVTAPVDGAAK